MVLRDSERKRKQIPSVSENLFWRELEGREVLGIGFVLLVTTSFVPRCSALRLLNSVTAGHSAHFLCKRLKFTISTRPTLYLYFRKQEVVMLKVPQKLSAAIRGGYTSLQSLYETL